MNYLSITYFISVSWSSVIHIHQASLTSFHNNMSFQVEYFSGIIAGQVNFDDTKLQDVQYISGHVPKFAPMDMPIIYALAINNSNKIMIVPTRLRLQMKFA
jgi:hypothetical protein